MYPTEEQFDDFKVAEETPEMEFAVAICDRKRSCRVIGQQIESMNVKPCEAERSEDELGSLKSQIATSSWTRTRGRNNIVIFEGMVRPNRMQKPESRVAGNLHSGKTFHPHTFNGGNIMLQKRQKYNSRRLSCCKNDDSLT